MSNIVEQAKVAVALDGRDAETVLSELTAKTNQYTDALTNAYKAGDKLGMKNALKDLKDSEKQLETFKKQTFDVTQVLKNLNGTSLKDLKKAEQEITAELSKMKRGTEEYVNKTKDLQKVTAEISKVKSEMRGLSQGTEQTGFSFKRMFEVMGGMAAWSLIQKGFGMIKEGLMNIINSTEEGADQFEFAMAGMRNGVEYFWKTLKTGDWSNFLTNMREAIKAGREYAEVMDDVKDRTRSLSMQEADLRDENNELEIALRNKTLAEEERVKAGQKRMQNEIDLAKKRTDIAQEQYDADIKIAMQRSKLSKIELEDIIKNYDEEKRADAKRYNDLFTEQAKINALTSGLGVLNKWQWTDRIKEIETSLKAFPEDIRKYAAIIRGEGGLKENMIDNIVTSYVKLKEAATSGKENIKKVITSTNTLLAGEENDSEKRIKKAEDERKKAQELALKSLETTHKQHQNLEKERYAKGEIDIIRYDARIYTIEDTYLEARKNLLRSFGQDTTDIETQIADRKVKRAEEIQQAFVKSEEEVKKVFVQMNDEIDKFFQKQGEEELAQAEAGFSDQQQADLDRLVELTEWKKQYTITSFADQMLQEEQMLTEWHEKSFSSEEDYQAALFQMKMKYVAEYTQQAQQLVSLYGDFVSAQQDAELAKMETNKARELKAAGNNADRKKAIEEKYGREELKIKKKYADKQFAAQIAQIIVAGAISIVQCFAQLGPIAGAIAAVLVGATVGFQISKAKAERDAVKQLAKGKYNVIGADDGQHYDNVPYDGKPSTRLYTRPTLIAERGPEIVMSAPHVRNLQINYPEILNAIMATRVPQYATGNYSAVGSQQSAAINTDQLVMILAANAQAINNLNSKLDNLEAKVVMDQFTKVQTKYDNLKSDVTQS